LAMNGADRIRVFSTILNITATSLGLEALASS